MLNVEPRTNLLLNCIVLIFVLMIWKTQLLGNNLLQAGSATISYNSSSNQEPTVTFNHPEYFSPLVLFKNSDELTLCKGIGSLGPYEMGSMMVYLDSGAQVLRTDFILITPLAINDVVIIPSRSDLNWDSTANCYVATACIVNLTDTTFSNENIEARFEVINKYQSILLDGEITENLRNLVFLVIVFVALQTIF